MKHTLSICLVLTLLFSLCVPAMAAEDATGTTLRLEETTGTVAVKDAAGMDKSARTGMRLYNGYTVETGASSSAYISLDETKAVKLDASGKVEIKKQGKKLEVSLTSGQLFFNVAEPLKTDESLNIRTSTMVTGIRGSFGWVNQEHMGLMHGHVTLTCINPETGESRVMEVYSGELVRYEQGSQETAADPTLLAIDFVKEEIRLEAIPAIVAEEVANSETLQAQLAADTTAVTVTELVESLPEKQAEEKAAETAAQAQVEAAVSAQEQAITAAAAADALSETTLGGTGQAYADLSANTPTATDSGSSGGGDSSGGSSSGDSSSGGSSSGGDSGSAAPAPAPASVTVYNADEIQSALNSYTIVTYAWDETSTNPDLDPISTLTIPSGKTLIIGDGTVSRMLRITSSMTNRGTVTIQSGSTLEFMGDASVTCDNYGTVNLYGSIYNASNGTFNNYGTVNNYSN